MAAIKKPFLSQADLGYYAFEGAISFPEEIATKGV
jgi:hypothetical protein